MWYENKYRRHLLDMHIDDWSEEFLRDFSAEKYFKNLQTAKIDSAMIYFQSHVGLCYFPTKTGKMHSAFLNREDEIKKLCELCRENGISVTGYYSLIYNNRAYHDHPDWRIIPSDGETDFGDTEIQVRDNGFSSNTVNHYGLCCPNNPDYRKFVSAQIKEISDYFTFDGMFYDMLFWPKRCNCKHCKSRFLKETGCEIPQTEDWNNSVWRLYIQKLREWMGEFAEFATAETKCLNPEVSVEHNTAFAVLPDAKKGLAERVLNACDYLGGDLYGGIYHQSFACKFYKNFSKNQPFEYMLARCEPNLSKHTVTKSRDSILSEMFLTLAHHGANFVIDAIDPSGSMDERFYKMLGEIFSKTIPFEKYRCGEMIEDIGIYYSLRSKFNAHGEPFDNHTGAVNTTKSLIINNIPCGVTGSLNDISRYKCILAPCLTQEDDFDAERLVNYVKNGGYLYLSGGDCKTLLKEFFGAEVCGHTRESVTYIAPKNCDSFGWFTQKYPLHFDATAPLITKISENTEVLATLSLPKTFQDEVRFVSIHSNPPSQITDYPTVLFTKYGKGKVLYSALPIDNIPSPYQYKKVLLSLLSDYLGINYTVTSDAPEDVEITAFKDENSITVYSVQLCEGEKARKLYPFEISVYSEQEPQKILNLPSETETNFTYENNRINFTVDITDIANANKIIFR